MPKNSTVAEYSHSTAFEGLIGYLFLTKKKDRLNEIMEKCIKYEKTIDETDKNVL